MGMEECVNGRRKPPREMAIRLRLVRVGTRVLTLAAPVLPLPTQRWDHVLRGRETGADADSWECIGLGPRGAVGRMSVCCAVCDVCAMCWVYFWYHREPEDPGWSIDR